MKDKQIIVELLEYLKNISNKELLNILISGILFIIIMFFVWVSLWGLAIIEGRV